MMQQMVLSQVIGKQVNNFAGSGRDESRSENASAKLTASQKMALAEISRISGVSTSSIISDAVEFYIANIEHKDKLIRYISTVRSLLETLP